MQHLYETPSDIIRAELKKAGIKQRHLAEKLGISPQHLFKILNKNQEKSQYIPKIMELLGLDNSILKKSSAKSIKIFSDKDLISLSDGSVLFQDLSCDVFRSWPSYDKKDYFFFAYDLLENISSRFCKQDLLIFSSSIPLEMTGRLGIAFIKESTSIFLGTLIYNKKSIIIFNEHKHLELNAGDLLLGIGVHLERNIEKRALV